MTVWRSRLVPISTSVLLLGAVVLDVFLFSDALVPYAEGVVGPTTDPGVVVACAALAWILLIVQRFAPLAVSLTICLYSVVMSLATSYTPVVVVCVALAAVTSRMSPRWSIVAALVAAASSVSWIYAEQRAYDYSMEFAALMVVESAYLSFLAVAAGIGWWRQVSRRDAERKKLEAEEAKIQATRAAITGERRRVARELHDIVAHAVTLMVLHSSGARTVMPNDPERAAIAMQVVEETGTQAMAELRRLLNVLRSDGDPHTADAPAPKGLSALPALVESVKTAGIRVSVSTVGNERPLDTSVDAAAYRVVSESLTNITKHSGPGTTADVLLQWSANHLDIDVRDDGRGSGSDPRLSTGNGLLGLTERIVLVGGDFEAHPLPTGGYEVHATLPLSTVDPNRTEVFAQ